MANYHEVISALDGESLTEALQQLENYASKNGFTELENWCKQELQGYEEDVPSYRIREVDWIDAYGQNISEQNRVVTEMTGVVATTLRLPDEIPVVNGVVQIERENRKNGFAHLPVPKRLGFLGYGLKVRQGRLSTSEIDRIFDGVRGEARRKMDRLWPEQSTTATRHPTPKFHQIIEDARLAQILEQRWLEAIAVYDAEAYLMTMVSLGAILEGVLLAQVKQNPGDANATSATPKDKNGDALPFEKWKLDSLIQVSHSCEWLEGGLRDFLVTLRDYRNLVHPREQLRKGGELSQGTCSTAWEAVTAAIDDIAAFQNANQSKSGRER